jgi:hypothetical protein
MSRNITKRIDLNELEAKTLKMKAAQCHLSEGEYVRELIMSSQPVEAPPRQFYVQMERVNRIAATIQRICTTAQDKEGIAELKSLYVQLIGHIVEIKECVSKARFFALNAYQDWEHQVELAKKEGRIPPPLEGAYLRDNSTDIEDPATDPELGWNALGIRPPFLGGGDAADSSDVTQTGDDGWQSIDEPAQTDIKGESDNPQDTESIDSYVSSRIFEPPRKEEDY